jgi:UPF0755 protein
MRKNISIIILIVIIFSMFLGVSLGRYIRENKITKNSSTIFYTVPKDPSVEKLAEEFKKREIIKSKLYFILYSKYMNLEGNIKNSKIMIEHNIPISQLAIKLKSDKPDFAVITIPEGFRLYQVAERLEKNSLVDKSVFVNIGLKDIRAEELIPKRNDVILDVEGFLFPDTYYIPLSFDEKDIASLMFNRFRTIFDERHIDRAKELGLSINEVITIASLIEREAITEGERSTIAGVIYNRLRKGMLLQIDATVIYANTKGEGHLSRVLYSHLKFNSKYNTYVYKGFPPGPIASPGKPSIEAALYPEQHDYLYYVAGSNGHVFSKTYEEHQANIKKYMKK